MLSPDEKLFQNSRQGKIISHVDDFWRKIFAMLNCTISHCDISRRLGRFEFVHSCEKLKKKSTVQKKGYGL